MLGRHSQGPSWVGAQITRFRYILLMGFLARLLLAPFLAHTFDVYAWYAMIVEMVRSPFMGSLFRRCSK